MRNATEKPMPRHRVWYSNSAGLGEPLTTQTYNFFCSFNIIYLYTIHCNRGTLRWQLVVRIASWKALFWASGDVCPGFQSQGGFSDLLIACDKNPELPEWSILGKPLMAFYQLSQASVKFSETFNFGMYVPMVSVKVGKLNLGVGGNDRLFSHPPPPNFYDKLPFKYNLWWIISIEILNMISQIVADEFLQTTLLLKPSIFTDDLCSL